MTKVTITVPFTAWLVQLQFNFELVRHGVLRIHFSLSTGSYVNHGCFSSFQSRATPNCPEATTAHISFERTWAWPPTLLTLNENFSQTYHSLILPSSYRLLHHSRFSSSYPQQQLSFIVYGSPSNIWSPFAFPPFGGNSHDAGKQETREHSCGLTLIAHTLCFGPLPFQAWDVEDASHIWRLCDWCLCPPAWLGAISRSVSLFPVSSPSFLVMFNVMVGLWDKRNIWEATQNKKTWNPYSSKCSLCSTLLCQRETAGDVKFVSHLLIQKYFEHLLHTLF